MPTLSPLRAQLASFEHAYAVAVQQRRASNHSQFIVRTGNLMQPFRVVARPPVEAEDLLARVA